MAQRSLRAAGLLMVLLLAAGAARAQISEAAAERLMRLSGAWAQMGTLVPQLRGGLAQGAASPDASLAEETRKRLRAASETAFDAERLRAVARRTLAESVRAKLLPELMAWYESEPGREVTRAEEAASASAEPGPKRIEAGVALLKQATPERRQLLARMVEVTRSAQLGTDMVFTMAMAVRTALLRIDGSAVRGNEAQMRADFDTHRGEMLRMMEAMSLANGAGTYRGLPDAVLTAYVDFMAGAAGEHFNDVMSRAVEAALLDGAEAIGR